MEISLGTQNYPENSPFLKVEGYILTPKPKKIYIGVGECKSGPGEI